MTLPLEKWRVREGRSQLASWDGRVFALAAARGPLAPGMSLAEGVSVWTSRWVDGSMEISNGEHTLRVPVSGGPMPVVFCFDLNGSLVYGWDDGSGYTWAYFDELEADWREVYLPGVHDLCCAVDHYTAEGGDSGVVLMYTRGTEVLVRYQVERYQVEHLFMVLEKPVPLRTIGLSPEYRFSIRFEDKVEVALFPDQLEGYVPPDPPDPGTGDFIGGLDPAQGWYRYSHSPV